MTHGKRRGPRARLHVTGKRRKPRGVPSVRSWGASASLLGLFVLVTGFVLSAPRAAEDLASASMRGDEQALESGSPAGGVTPPLVESINGVTAAVVNGAAGGSLTGDGGVPQVRSGVPPVAGGGGALNLAGSAPSAAGAGPSTDGMLTSGGGVPQVRSGVPAVTGGGPLTIVGVPTVDVPTVPPSVIPTGGNTPPSAAPSTGAPSSSQSPVPTPPVIAPPPGSATNFTYVADTPGLTANPATRPAVWPNATNTGVPAGTTLTASGSLVITSDRTIVSDLNIAGCVDVDANNVVIRNSRITCNRASPAIDVEPTASGFLLQDSEVDGSDVASGCIGFGDFTLLRDNLHDCVDGIDGGGNAVVEYTYVHDLIQLASTHNDAFQTVGGVHNLLVGNTFESYRASTGDLMNSAIQTGHLNSDLTDTLVEYNYLDGGNFTVNAGAQSTNGFTIAGYIFVGNDFGPHSRYGPVAELGPGISFDSSNVWAGTNTPVH